MLYGIAGLAGAGKDTVANLLADMFRKVLEDKPKGMITGVRIDSFAAPLRDAATGLFGTVCITDREVKERAVQIHPVALRAACQSHILCTLGNESDLVSATVLGDLSDNVISALNLAAEVFGLPSNDMITISPREFMQKLGTDVIRAVDEKAYAKRLYRDADPSMLTIVPDVRFLNESKGMLRLFNVVRPSLEYNKEGVHVSEEFANELYNMYQATMQKVVSPIPDTPFVISSNKNKRLVHIVNNSTLQALQERFGEQ